MSGQEQMLINELLRARIIQTEYEGLDENKIKRIYMEETGTPLDVDVNVYYSEDYVDEVEYKGFNGTILHFQDKEKGINQVYTIPRGTEGPKEDGLPHDAAYDLMGIFAGISKDQFEGLVNFEQNVLNEIKEETGNSKVELEKIGLGHSLGGGLMIMLQLYNGDYDHVYTINSAAASVYKMAIIDPTFGAELSNKFGINLENDTDIYKYNPESLEEFAKKFYAEKASVIEHTTLEQDLLQAIFPIRGFFETGSYNNPINAFENQSIESLREVFDNFPDEVAKELQIYLVENLADPYNEEGIEGILHQLLGIDLQKVEEFTEASTFKKIRMAGEMHSMIQEIREKAPELIKMIEAIRGELPDILNALVKTGYITEAEKNEVLSQVDLIIGDIKAIHSRADRALRDIPFHILTAPLTAPHAILRYLNDYLFIKNTLDEAKGRLDIIRDYMEDVLGLAIHGGNAHRMKFVIESLRSAKGSRTADNGDVIISLEISASGDRGGMCIEVNLSSAVRIYMYGLDFVEQKEALLQELMSAYEQSYISDYEYRKNALLSKIEDMEKYPYRYQHLVGRFTSDSNVVHKVSHIRVNEDIATLPRDGFKLPFENAFSFIEKEIKEERKMLKSFEEAIKALFDRDETIAQQIKG